MSGPGHAMVNRALPPIPGEAPPMVPVDFLIPTGIIIPMQCNPWSTLSEIKERLYQEAKNFPLFSLLKDQGFYNFLGITNDGEKEEFYNEAAILADLDLFMPMLKLVERQGNQEEKLINAEISNIIGRRLHDFDVMGSEVQDFRRNILNVVEQAVTDRTSSDRSTVLYNFPPVTLRDDDIRVTSMGRKVTTMAMTVCSMSSDGKVHRAQLQVNVISTIPSAFVSTAMRSKELRHLKSVYKARDVVLKVIGKEEYFLEDAPLIQYKYVLDCITKQLTPQFSVVPFADLVPLDKDVFVRPVMASQTASGQYGGYGYKTAGHTGTLARPTANASHTQFVSIWTVQETYRVKILSCKNINVTSGNKVYVRGGIYYGVEPLCQVVHTLTGANPEKAEWNEILEFDLPIKELPRATKLCFVIMSAPDAAMAKKAARKRKQKDIAPIGWVNMAAFDYASRLQTGPVTLYAWPVEAELDDEVNYIGSTVQNSSTSECISLKIDILAPALPPSAAHGNKPIMYPSYDQIRKFANEVSQVSISTERFPSDLIQALQKVVDQDPLAQLDEQDKELIWRMRNVCLDRFPKSLPKLLQSIQWNNRSDVAQVYILLQRWKRLKPEEAMELLDYQYADIAVRNWAVECLEVLTDEKLLMYLLQLVQVLKFEPYLDCALGQFLLRRALQNKTIGHYLFWHLRSEMHLPTVSVRFGLMLEAYCRGCGNYMKELAAQHQALTKMKQMTELLRSYGKKEANDLLKDLKTEQFTSAMMNLTSPLDPSQHCKQLKVDKCKVMDSKMRPMWLVFQNQDTLGDDILQIFKNGDDLRQDMLTLQIMGIMDSQWKQAGLDLRMSPYGCLSTGDQVGMIEVVLSASTIAKIQKRSKGAKGAFDKKILFQWLKEQNPNPGDLEKAIENFRLSCAGSCVATYVLGIGDRHSDNIMLRKNGQLVHIDFGHFLGNFKSKFGVKRERVPFVLTDDFIYIITNEGDKNSQEFQTFKSMCENAFLTLRDSGELFINLFTMMKSCGIPELRTANDISYIREALCLGTSKQQALENFRKKLQEAVKSAWTVSWNWYFHNVKVSQ